MKNRNKLFYAFAVIFLTGCAGMGEAIDRNKPIEMVFSLPGITKEQAFSATRAWVAETFVSSKTVTDDTDKEAGRIILKGRVPRPCEGAMDCMTYGSNLIGFTLRVDIKDGKLKTTYTNLTTISPPTRGGLTTLGSPEQENSIFMQNDQTAAQKALKTLSEQLVVSIKKETSPQKDF